MATEVPNFDIHHAADLLLRLQGSKAEAMAQKRADHRMLSGDTQGMLAWCLVAKAIEEREDRID